MPVTVAMAHLLHLFKFASYKWH